MCQLSKVCSAGLFYIEKCGAFRFSDEQYCRFVKEVEGFCYTQISIRRRNRSKIQLVIVQPCIYAYPVRMAIKQRATALQTSVPCWKPMPQTTRNCALWMSLWMMATPARTLNALRFKGCFRNWSKEPSTAFWSKICPVSVEITLKWDAIWNGFSRSCGSG